MDLLNALSSAPVRKEYASSVTELSPTMIADTYMDSKMNSIRIALLRGYVVPQEELDLLKTLSESSRRDAHRLFLSHYQVGEDFFPIGDLSAIYSVGEENVVVGPGRSSHLAFLFYAKAPDAVTMLNSITNPGYHSTEYIAIGKDSLSASEHNALIKEAVKRYDTAVGKKAHPDAIPPKFYFLVTNQLSRWILDNPYVPKMRLFKQGVGLENLAKQRGLESTNQLSELYTDDVLIPLLGAERGDILEEIRYNIDSSAIASRDVLYRQVVERRLQ